MDSERPVIARQNVRVSGLFSIYYSVDYFLTFTYLTYTKHMWTMDNTLRQGLGKDELLNSECMPEIRKKTPYFSTTFVEMQFYCKLIKDDSTFLASAYPKY